MASVPSAQMVNAASVAATSPHALVNLIRLVKSLDASSSDLIENDVTEGFENKATLTKDINSAKYARVLLERLQEGNEQSSTTANTLQDLDNTMHTVEKRYADLISLNKPNGNLSQGRRIQATYPSNPQSSQNLQASFNTISKGSSTPVPQPPDVQPPPLLPRQSSARLRQRKTPNLSEYLSARDKEDAKGDETGLIPLRTRSVKKEPSSRDHLLGAGAGVGMGAAQLHEELGGQLADMSHRLKLNAVHFANSLEEEKALLESSQQTLENNLTTTRSSKKNLSAVSRKGRGTTCMTLGIVLLVLIIFVWTYMLIRFT